MNKLIFKLIRYSGLPFLFRELVQKRKVTILLFHDISRETAEKTFLFLSEKYNIISLDDFLRACRDKNERALPDKALILTFDDGHLGNYRMKPVLEKMRIPVTIFLCAGIIDTNRHYWFTYKHPEISKSSLKRLSNRQKLELLAKAGFRPEKEFDHPQAMNRQQIVELTPLVDFQAHTLFHPCLPQCDDREAQEEIVAAKQKLESDFGLPIRSIAYPNGDYSERDIALSKKAGYECGITVDYGFNTIRSDLFRLKRLSVNDSDNLDELAVKASGVWAFFKTRNGKKQGFGWTDKVAAETSPDAAFQHS